MIKPVRSLSGVTPLAVMMKPYNCPGLCVYCPQELNMPKSYLSDEPAAQRAQRLDFDPYKQVEMRLAQLAQNGHPTDKLEIIVIGGTFSAYPDDYKTWFIGEIYRAANNVIPTNVEESLNNQTRKGSLDYVRDDRGIARDDREGSMLKQVQHDNEMKRNETAKQRIVALSVETRPDWVTEAEVKLIRRLGATKIQLGVQAIDDEIAKKTKRGHGIAEVAEATRFLRNAGLKICYHIMPNLPGSTPEKDIEMSRLIYSDLRFKPDYVKIYPCMVIPQTELHRMWQRGEHKTYSDDELNYVLKEISAITPEWVRVDRLVRDISRKWVASGTIKTNFRQIVEEELKKEGRPCVCVRCREVRGGEVASIEDLVFRKIEYDTLGGKEVFLSFEKDDKLYALLRMRLPDTGEKMLFDELKGAAIIREVHTYGRVVGLPHPGPLLVKERGGQEYQHRGLGRRLIEDAEKLAKMRGYKKIAVISAIGTHEYYRKLGYELEGLYMTKAF